MPAIVDGGGSEYQIVTPGRHFPPENHAAEILQDALFEMTGVRLPVRWRHQRLPCRPAILVGIGREKDEPRLWTKDEWEIRPEGNDLVLSGSDRRGTHYAVHAFLESLGARFFGPGDIELPKLDRVEMPRAAGRSAAAFSHRHVFYPTAQEPEWALRWKLNVHDGADARWGPNASAHSFGHSFEALVPVARHFAAHPEYFSFVDGRRRDRAQQLCCTSPAVADAACETLAQWIAANPAKRIFAVGMNDWLGWCECPECAKADAREGGPTGQLLTLVNRVAERFPDRIVATLAYSWAIDPPREMHARDNVLVVLCHNDGCFTHALDGCERNRRFLDRLNAWKGKSNRILIWDYYVNYHSYLMPTPNFRRIGRDFRIYRDIGIEGMFCQGSACRGGQFEGVRQYLMAKLLWDPAQDAWGIVEEWANGVYGKKAAGPILEYLAVLEDHVEKDAVHMPSFGSGQEVQPEIFTPEVLARGAALWDQAETSAAKANRRKVFAARAPEMCSRLFHAACRYEMDGETLRPSPAVDAELRGRFVRAAIAGDAAHLREDDGAPEAFGRNFGRAYETAVLRSDAVEAVLVPELGGRLFSLLIVMPTGERIGLLRVADMLRTVNFFPYGAGYEFSVDPRWKGRGTSEAYRIAERDGGSRVVLRAELAGALALDSEFALDGDTLRIRHRVENRGTAPAEVRPFTHPEWSYDAFGAGAQVRLRTQDGSWRAMPLNPEKRGGRDLSFDGPEMPAGAWRLESAAFPVALEESFDPESVERARIAFGAGANLNLELYFRTKTIAPGAKETFGAAWKVTANR